MPTKVARPPGLSIMPDEEWINLGWNEKARQLRRQICENAEAARLAKAVEAAVYRAKFTLDTVRTLQRLTKIMPEIKHESLDEVFCFVSGYVEKLLKILQQNKEFLELMDTSKFPEAQKRLNVFDASVVVSHALDCEEGLRQARMFVGKRQKDIFYGLRPQGIKIIERMREEERMKAAAKAEEDAKKKNGKKPGDTAGLDEKLEKEIADLKEALGGKVTDIRLVRRVKAVKEARKKTVLELAEMLGVKASSLNFALPVLDLSQLVQDIIERGEVSISSAYNKICRAKLTPEKQLEAAKQIATNALVNKKREKPGRNPGGKKDAPAGPKKDPSVPTSTYSAAATPGENTRAINNHEGEIIATSETILELAKILLRFGRIPDESLADSLKLIAIDPGKLSEILKEMAKKIKKNA